MIQKALVENETVDQSWDFKGGDTQRGAHGIHTYLAAMIPQVAERLIKQNVPKNGRILDPFCGGGAVLVESIMNGFPSVGVDINPLAVLISKAKTTYIDQADVKRIFREILYNAEVFQGHPIEFPTTYRVNYWFKSYALKPLTALISQISKIEDENTRTFFECVFSGTVRDVSLTYRNEQRLRRFEPRDYERFNPDVLKSFSKRAEDSMRRLSYLPKGPRPNVVLGSVMELPFEDLEFTNIICSPPYGDERNGVPYSQFSKNMLIWLGHRREDLLNLKKLTLGGQKSSNIEFKSDYLRTDLEFLTKKQAREEALGFYNDYYKAIKEMIRVTSYRISIVIGSRTLQGRKLDNGQITVDFMESLGAALISQHTRKLPHKRLPKMGSNFGAEINEEKILTFKV